MLRKWSGVGGDDQVPCACTHVECHATGLGRGGMITFLQLAHMLNAMQMVWGVGGMTTLFALAHMLNAAQMAWGGGGMIRFLALAHMLSAMQMVWGGDWDDNVPCTCKHVE